MTVIPRNIKRERLYEAASGALDELHNVIYALNRRNDAIQNQDVQQITWPRVGDIRHAIALGAQLNSWLKQMEDKL